MADLGFTGMGYGLIAQLFSQPVEYLCGTPPSNPFCDVYLAPLAPGQFWQFGYTLPKLSAHFPHGYLVSPDH